MGIVFFAVHFYPLTTLKVEGKPLFWWTPAPGWTRRLNFIFYDEIQKIIAASGDSLPGLRWPSTRLLHAARQALALDKREGDLESNPPPLCDVVGIHATNYGTAASYDELRISRGLLEFWSQAGVFDLYRRIEQEAWQTDEAKHKKKRPAKEVNVEQELSPVI